MYDSLRSKLMTLPNNMFITVGSSCRKNLGSDTFSTIEQKLTNYALQPMIRRFYSRINRRSFKLSPYFLRMQ